MTLRHLCAWLLLVTISLQWIGGVLYVKVSESSLVEVKMSEAEEALAQRLEQDYGIKSEVRIINAHDRQAMLFAGYATPFIFSEEQADSTWFFTLEAENVEMVTAEQIICFNNPHHQENQFLVVLNQLFSPYIAPNYFPEGPFRTLVEHDQNFHYQFLKNLFSPQRPTPPPLFLG